MLASQDAQSQLARQHGCGQASLAELRCRLASPSDLPENCRQRLLTLAQRLRRVQGITEDEYIRVELSEYVTSAMDRGALTV